MKKIYSLLFTIFVLCSISARNTIYVSPNGGYDGTKYNRPCTFSQMVDSLYNSPNLVGEIFVYFSEGDYYDVEIKLWNMPQRITNVHLQGGYKFARSMPPYARDFVSHETIFHAKNSDKWSIPVWMECLSTMDTTKISSVDGITFTSDSVMHNDALRLVGGNYVVTHCKFTNYKTTGRLMMLETYAVEHVFIINTLIENNVCGTMFGMFTNFHMINTTIADNTFLYFGMGLNHTSSICNSIIWNNSDLYLEPYSGGTIDISYSFVQSQELWMNNNYTNQWNVDPQFTYDNDYPYTCDAISNVFQYGDDSVFSQYSWAFQYYETDYDVAGNDRFYGSMYGSFYDIDAGAYQHYYAGGGSNYNIISYPDRTKREIKKSATDHTNNIQLWSHYNVVNIEMEEEKKLSLVLYSTSGQSVYSTTVSERYNSIILDLQRGDYIAILKSEDDRIIKRKLIRL